MKRMNPPYRKSRGLVPQWLVIATLLLAMLMVMGVALTSCGENGPDSEQPTQDVGESEIISDDSQAQDSEATVHPDTQAGEDTPSTQAPDVATEGKDPPATQGENTPDTQVGDTPATQGEDTPNTQGGDEPVTEGDTLPDIMTLPTIEPVTLPPIIELPPDPPVETDAQGEEITSAEPETEAETISPELHPGDSSQYAGVMISAVYGTGKKNIDAAAEAGFIQLYNSNSKAVSLGGSSLYYKSDGTKPYSQFVFPADATIPAGGYYLVRCNPVANYDSSYAVLSVTEYDAQWDETLDNKEIRLVFAPTGWSISRDDNILSFTDAISVFYASDTTIIDHQYAIDGLSKNKVAVRTALKDYSGFHKVNLTERATGELQQVAPRTSTGKVNAVVASRLNEVVFSKPAGIYHTSFNLTLTADKGYTIYYTTDGSDPTTSSTRRKYSAAIALKDTSAVAWGNVIKRANDLIGAPPTSSTMVGGHTIKAYATNGTESTPVYTNSYFITDDLQSYGVPVLSMSLPLDSFLYNKDTNADDPRGFYNRYLLNSSNVTAGRRRGMAVMEVFDESGKRVGYSNIEIAVSGNGSAGGPMKSMRVYYKNANNMEGGVDSDLDYDIFQGYAKDAKGNVITSFERLILRNSGNDVGHSYIRDAYMQRVSANTKVATMAMRSSLLFVNGEFWGVYNVRERYSPEYYESHYGPDENNIAVIESDYAALVYGGDPAGPYVDTAGVTGYAAEFNELVAYMNSHNLATASDYQYVCDRMDIETFIDMWVVRCYFNARDWPENNMKVWKNTNPDDASGFNTKWHFSLLDTDMGISFYEHGHWADTSEYADFLPAFIGSGSVCGQMMRALLQNQEFKDKFITRYYEIVTQIFTPDYLSAVLENLVKERTPLMALQVQRWGNYGASVNTFNGDVSEMRSFVKNRQQYALNSLYNYFGVTADQIENMSSRSVTLSYANGSAEVKVNGTAYAAGTTFRFEQDSYTFNVEATAKEGYAITAIEFTGRDGKTQRVEGNTATFKVTGSGTISISVKRTQTMVTTGGSIIAGPTYMFYLAENGDLYAWGDNRGGVLGLGESQTTIPTPTLVMTNVAKVATTRGSDVENGATTWMTAILTKDGKLYTVGANGSGQLGRNGTNSSTSLGQVSFSGGTITDVSVGHDHLLVLTDKGELWGVGNNAYGQLGTAGMGSAVTSFQKVASTVTHISAGRRQTTYISAFGVLYGLGDNRWNKMSATAGETISTPLNLLSGTMFDFVASGEHQIVAVTKTGDLYYAGWRDFNSFGQGGGNNPAMRKVMGDIAKADIYFSNLVILDKSGNAYVYGLNEGNGIGSVVTGGTPKKIYEDVVDVAAGFGFTAYLCKDGTIRILGNNTYGQAGTGTIGGTVNFSQVDL